MSANARTMSRTAGPGDPDVGVAPLGLVRRADVVAADEPDLVVDHQDLAVVAAVAAQVEEPPAGAVDRVAQHLHRRREALEGGGDDQVREPVVDAVDLDPAGGGVGQRGLEPLADRVALPDVGLEEDPPLGALDRREHVGVQVLAEGVRRDRAVADLDRGRLGDRERLGLLARGAGRSRPGSSRSRSPSGCRTPPATCAAGLSGGGAAQVHARHGVTLASGAVGGAS